MATFSRSGLYHTLSGTLGHLSSDLVNDSAQGSSEQLLEYQYQCAWRLQQWDTLDATTEKNDSNFLFERERFFALKGLVFSEKDTFQKHISNAR